MLSLEWKYQKKWGRKKRKSVLKQRAGSVKMRSDEGDGDEDGFMLRGQPGGNPVRRV